MRHFIQTHAMRGSLIILNLFFLISSCKENDKNKITEIATAEKSFVPKYGKEFFEYDKIEYYNNDIDSVDALENNKGLSKLNNLKYEIILGETPKKLDDFEFLPNLEKINFQKSEIDKSKFGEINKIFVEKTVNQIADYACIAVYRDILIFKKQNKTIGIAKICFECFKKQIIGTNANTENFGQDGDYEKLEKILKN